LFTEENRTLLVDEVEKVKLEALKTPAQGIIAALEGMKMRKDREVLLHVTTFPKMLILGKKDGVLNYDENTNQIENTDVQLLSFPDGHMSQIENKAETLKAIIDFMKKI
jgi:pimeloyl-ACP methyl ester carboxylesterase